MRNTQQAGGQWHATDHEIEPEEHFLAFCGHRFTTTQEDYPALGGRPSRRMCPDCLQVMREMAEE